jgi:hypothetical protein
VLSISNTERPILDFALQRIGAGKITTKKTTKAHHAPGFTYAIWNRQALSLLLQIEPFLRSYKRHRAALVRDKYIRLTPRNGKYTASVRAARQQFETELLALRANIGIDAPHAAAPVMRPGDSRAQATGNCVVPAFAMRSGSLIR